MDHVNTVVLESALAILSGGVDRQGNLLVVFPPDCADLLDVYSSCDILKLLKEYVTIAGRAVSIVANLKNGWTEECIVKFTGLLDGLQTWRKESLHTAYLIKPCTQSKKRMLHRQLSRLHSYGRTVTSYKTYHSVVKITEKLISAFPTIKNEIESYREKISASQAIPENIESTMGTQYEATLKKFNVHETIKQCEDTLKILGHPDLHTDLVNVSSSLIENTATRLLKMHGEITQQIDSLNKIVFRERHDQERQKKIDICRNNSNEVVETIVLLNQQIMDLPLIGENATEAQTNRNTFIADVLHPSKDIIDCASSILQNLSTDKDTTPSSYKASLEIARQLTEALQPFTAHINTLNDTYTRIHMFYVIYNKVSRWKEKASTFIDLHLAPLLETALSDNKHADKFEQSATLNSEHAHFSKYSNLKTYLYCNKSTNGLLKEIKIKAPAAWDILMDHFRYKHPPPKRKHLRLITKNVADFIDKPHLVDAETLAERTMFILAFFSRKCFKGEDILLILKWRNVAGTVCGDDTDVVDDLENSDLEVTTV